MSTKIDTRECEASFFVLKRIAKMLCLAKEGNFLFNCPSPNCVGMIKVVIKGEDCGCCVTAQCINSSPECNFPTLSGPLEWNYEGKETE